MKRNIDSVYKNSLDTKRTVDLLKSKQIFNTPNTNITKINKIMICDNILLTERPLIIEKILTGFPEEELMFTNLVSVFYGEDGFPIDLDNVPAQYGAFIIYKSFKKIKTNDVLDIGDIILRISIYWNYQEIITEDGTTTGYDRPLYLSLYLTHLNTRR